MWLRGQAYGMDMSTISAIPALIDDRLQQFHVALELLQVICTIAYRNRFLHDVELYLPNKETGVWLS